MRIYLQEELTVKLLEFLESPHATTDLLLANKEKVSLNLLASLLLFEGTCAFLSVFLVHYFIAF